MVNEISKKRKGLLSIVIPAYNEGQNINKCIESINKCLAKSNNIKYEIIFVDDGSTDDTWGIIKDACCHYKNVSGISFSRNFGKESAIMAGLSGINGECAVVMDSDLQHPPEKIIEMYDKWQDGFDIVEGIKASRGKEGAIKKIGARCFYIIMNRATGVDMTNASDFKLLDKAAVRTLVNIPERNAFFRALSSWVGYKTTVVKYTVNERTSGNSKWGVRKLAKYALSNISSFTTMPMQVITLLGIITLIAAVILTIIAVHDYAAGIALGGFTTVIILICFIGSAIMISLGIIGYYLAKIYEQVQDRPKYIIAERRMRGDEKG